MPNSNKYPSLGWVAKQLKKLKIGTLQINANHFFIGSDKADAISERTAYFASNPTELVEGVVTALVYGSTAERQIYSGVDWIDLDTAALTQEDRLILDSIIALENNKMIVSSLDGLKNIEVIFDEANNRMISNIDWEFPASSIFVSENLKISGANLAFGVTDLAGKRNGFLIAHTYNETGSQKPFYRKLKPSTNAPQQLLSNTTKSGKFTVPFLSAGNHLITKLTVESSESSIGTIAVVKDGVEIEKKTMSFVANEETIVIDTFNKFDGSFYLENDVEYSFVFSNVTLKGTGENENFINYFKTEAFDWEVAYLVEESNVDLTPEVFDICILNEDNQEIKTVETIDELEQEFIIRLVAANLQNLVSFSLLAQRGQGIEQLSETTINTITNGVNIKTLAFLDTDIDNLREKDGGIILTVRGLNSENQEVDLGNHCIRIEPKHGKDTISELGINLTSRQNYNTLPNKQGAKSYEEINSKTLKVTANDATITLEATNINLDFKLIIQNDNINFAAGGDVDIEGNLFPSNGDLINVTTVDNTFYLIKLN